MDTDGDDDGGVKNWYFGSMGLEVDDSEAGGGGEGEGKGTVVVKWGDGKETRVGWGRVEEVFG